MSTLSCELYRWLVLTTEEGSEPRLLIKSAGDHDWIAAWGSVHTKYKRRTITRLMRTQKGCMYPKEAKVEDMTTAVLA